MHPLATLIRLRKRDLDELRRQQAELETRRDQILSAMERLRDELLHEIQTAGELAGMGGFFGNFSEAIKKRQEKLIEEVKRVELRIQQFAERIRIDYGELKKFELSYERILERERAEAARREQKELDEIGLRNHGRKEDI